MTAGRVTDYVYRNQPSGRGLIGLMIDRRFLAGPGAEAVRIRRRHLEELLAQAVRDLRASGRAVSLVDIASGPASYILSVMEQMGEHDLVACCRDLDDRWLSDGRAEALRRGLHHIRFERGDAFDRDGLLAIRPRPNVVVSSGFYDWINEDEAVRRSMGLIFDALEPGGCAIVTNQMAHPNPELVSAVAGDFRDQPLRMKMRPASQMHGWLEGIGFVVQRPLIDSWGYHLVTKAHKPQHGTQ
jgi:SAM-dependent methyltransferase